MHSLLSVSVSVLARLQINRRICLLTPLVLSAFPTKVSFFPCHICQQRKRSQCTEEHLLLASNCQKQRTRAWAGRQMDRFRESEAWSICIAGLQSVVPVTPGFWICIYSLPQAGPLPDHPLDCLFDTRLSLGMPSGRVYIAPRDPVVPNLLGPHFMGRGPGHAPMRHVLALLSPPSLQAACETEEPGVSTRYCQHLCEQVHYV